MKARMISNKIERGFIIFLILIGLVLYGKTIIFIMAIASFVYGVIAIFFAISEPTSDSAGRSTLAMFAIGFFLIGGMLLLIRELIYF